jgi:hypothetical protein
VKKKEKEDVSLADMFENKMKDMKEKFEKRAVKLDVEKSVKNNNLDMPL